MINIYLMIIGNALKIHIYFFQADKRNRKHTVFYKCHHL